jgi:hypothetical protein
VLPREADWAAVLARWAEIVALKLDNTYVVWKGKSLFIIN